MKFFGKITLFFKTYRIYCIKTFFVCTATNFKIFYKLNSIQEAKESVFIVVSIVQEDFCGATYWIKSQLNQCYKVYLYNVSGQGHEVTLFKKIYQ